MMKFDKMCHRIFDANRSGKDYYAREVDVFCENCGHSVYVYYCEERLYLVECDCCAKKVLVKADNTYEAAINAFHAGW